MAFLTVGSPLDGWQDGDIFTCDGVILPFLISDEFSLNFPTLLLELHL